MVDTVDLTGSGDTVTIGGVIFQDSANVGSGTGNYATFLAVGDNDGNEAGFNTNDISPIEPSNPNQDLAKSETLLLGSIPIVLINGVAYYEFRVDLNEPNNTTTGQISLDTFRIYTSSSNQITTLGQLVDTNNTDIVYDMDTAFGSNVSLQLSEVSTGSGTDDYSVLIPVSLFGNADPATTYLYLYVEMGFLGGEFVGDSGFEEWNTQQAGTLTGVKFNDIDNDGIRDGNEGGVGGVTVFIDADQDGVLDGDTNGNGIQDGAETITERYTVTDQDGNYTFFGVALGTWQIDEVVPAGSTQTTGPFETATISTQNQIVVVAPIGNHYPVPAIDIQKDFADVTDGPDAGPSSNTFINGAGDIINYVIAVENTGETGLVNVVVTDPLATTLTEQLSGGFNIGDSDQDHVLDQGEIWFWTATQTATQNDLNTNGGGDGDIDNVAFVTADQEGATQNHVSDNDDAAAPVVASAALALIKTFTNYSGGNGDFLGNVAGDIANYSLTVTNTGNVTLTNVMITDPLTGLNHPVGTLAPGQSATVTAQYIVTQPDLDGGGNAGPDHDIDNTATATSDQTGPAQASAVAPLVYAPALAINKVVVDVDGDGPNGTADAAGDIITYRVSVTNTGNVTLTNVTVVDPLTGLNVNVPSLAVGATWTSADLFYVVQQSDIDGNGGGDGDIDNTATADSDQTGPADDSEDVPVDQNPALTIDKIVVDVDGDGPDGVADAAGDIITYRVSVTNTGNQTLTGVTVVDPLTGLNVPVGILAVGDTWTSADLFYEVTQADIDSNGGGDGDIDNTATADSDQTGPADDSEDVPVDQNPALTIDKIVVDVDGDGPNGTADAAGDIITYRVSVTNTGNQTLTGVTVVDPLTGLNVPVGILAVGGTWTSADLFYEVTQADIDSNGGGDGDIDNTATADSDQTGPADDSEDVPVDQNPALTIDKIVVDVDGDGPDGVADAAGDIITYRVSVTNTGNQTLTGVTVVDPLTGLNVPVGILAVGDTWTSADLFYEVTQADIDSNGGGDGDIDNTATADSDQTGPADDSEDVPVDQNPALMIDKIVVDVDGDGPDGVADAAGDIITYRVSVTNTGNQTLTGVTVVDPLTGLNVPVGILAVGATWTSADLFYVVQQSDIDGNGGGDGDIDNTATADSDQTGPADDSEDVPVDQNPALTIDKIVVDVDGDGPNGTADAAGDIITYRVSVTNTGNVTLTNVTVVDPLTGLNVNVPSLAVGATWTSADLFYVVQQSDIDGNGGGDGDIDNTATADSDQTGPADDSEDVPVDQNPALTIDKIVVDVDGDGPDGTADAAGDIITYRVSVTNTGNQTLTGVTVVDPLTGLNVPVGILAVGDTWTSADLFYEVTQADIDSNGGGDGDIDNTATADSDQTGPADDSEDVPVDQNPALTIDKIVVDVDGDGPDGTADAAGDIITYRVSVTNTGNQTLTGVTVVDPLTGLNVPVGILAVGDTWTSADLFYEVTQADIDSNGGGDGDIDNTATADSDQTGPADDSEDVPVDQNPALTIDKIVVDVDGDGPDGVADAAGDIITYRVSVTNTGNQTLTGVTVVDPLTGLNVPVGILAVGDTWTSVDLFYVVQQSDIDSNGGGDGDIDNTATADSDQTGPADDSEDVPVDQQPVLVIVKTGDTDRGDDCIDVVGENLVWSIAVSRAGNVDIDNVAVTDDRGVPVYVSGDDGDHVLEAGEVWYYTFSEEVTQAMINANAAIVNTATVNGDAVNSDEAAAPVSDDASVEVCQNPALTIVKTGDTDRGDDCIDVVGENIVWTINVTRSGNVDLDNVVVTDNRFGGGTTALVLAGGDTNGNGVLEAGETWTYSFTEEVTQEMINANAAIINTAYANGDALNSTEAATQVSDGATLEVCQDPELVIVKTGDTDRGDDCIDVVGENLVWTIAVSRAGNVDIDNVVVTDDRGVPVYVSGDDGDHVLEAGEVWYYTFSEEVTQAMINANAAIVNTATVNGDAVNSDEAATEVSDDASVEVCQNPALTIVKTGDTSLGDDCIDVVGENIVWTINVTRSGNVDLDNVVVTDNRFGGGTTALVLAGGDTNSNGVLEAGETWTYSFTEVVTQAMIDANAAIVNTAYANGDALNSDDAATQVSDDATVEVCQNPAISLEKFVLTDQSGGYLDADDPDGPIASTSSTVNFRVTLNNTGNVTLGAIALSDSVVHTVAGSETVQVLNYSNAALNAWVDLDGDTVQDAGEAWTTLDANNDGTLDTVTLAVGGSLNIYYSLTSELGQHENTAIVTATAVNGIETATDRDDANYYVLPSEDCVGVGTPGFWSNNGAVFWDGVQGNESKAGQPGFADGELLYAVDSNNDGVINASDVKGLLVGDYNHNGLTDVGEDTLFISYNDARTLINASNKVQQDAKYQLGRDVVATWLNYLANGGSDGNDSCIDRPGTSDDGFNPQHYIDDAIDWLQTFAGSRGNGMSTLSDNTTNEAFDNIWLGSIAIKTSSSYWSTAVAGVSDHAGSAMHNALDAYNNTGVINGVEFCCDRDNADALFAIQQIV